MDYPEITIGGPVRNRAWILPMYLQKLYELDYPKGKIRFLFVLNDSKDSSEQILIDFKNKYRSEYAGFRMFTINAGTPEDSRMTDEGRTPIYYHLANVRNSLIEKIETPYYLSVDTDILVPPHTIKTLLESDKDMVAGVIWNDYIRKPSAVYPDARPNFMINNGGKLEHYKKYPLNSLFEVHTTGAVCLMSKAICEKVRFHGSQKGEDIPFCIEAREKGFSVWVNSRVFAHHIMIVYQTLCRDCKRECKQVRVVDNQISPELGRCERRLINK